VRIVALPLEQHQSKPAGDVCSRIQLSVLENAIQVVTFVFDLDTSESNQLKPYWLADELTSDENGEETERRAG
jgi:hypothetical protein